MFSCLRTTSLLVTGGARGHDNRYLRQRTDDLPQEPNKAMGLVTIRHLLRAAFLLFVAALSKAQEPPRTCTDTGPTCIDSCVGQPSGLHQWCGSCQTFIQCSGDIIYYQQCAVNTYYSDDVQACVSVSNTCTECVFYAGSTFPASTTPAGGALCGNTGPGCISSCDQVVNGVYQWCARCDYFIECSGSSAYYMACQPNLYYDQTVKACVYQSTTCFQDPCYEDLASTPAPTICSSSPCAFGGTCIQDSIDSYHCVCAPGYTGQNCTAVISYCDSGPCLYGGTCLPVVGGYVCQCVPGYTGDRCQYVINNCASFPCLNGGTCQNQINSFVCQCRPEWTGVRCETLLDPCGSRPCTNGGVCVNNCGFPQCICSPGWSGTFCETYVDNCLSKPCQNGGTCQNIMNGWVCSCPPSFSGTYCEQVVDVCASRPCLNGGSCIFDCGIYQCICPVGYTGHNCQSPTSICDPNPCLNGGTCNDLGGDTFSCTCLPQWTGVICESPNYDETLACGTTLTWSNYTASNGFTRLCYFWAAPEDANGRATECRFTIHGIPLYDDYTGLMQAGGNFGCLVSQNYPSDLPATSAISCADNYQQDVTLGNFNSSARLMVCLRYPYDGIPGVK